jgi:hypothetical protein
MGFNIQGLVAGILFLAAVLYVLKPLFKKKKKNTGCDNCG